MRSLTRSMFSWIKRRPVGSRNSKNPLRRNQFRVQQIEVLEVRSLMTATGILGANHGSGPAALQQSAAVSDDQFFYFSSSSAGTLKSSNGNTLSITTSDIARLVVHGDGSYDYSLFFKGSNVGLSGGSESIDAFTVLSDGSLLISTTSQTSVPGVVALGADLLKFVPQKLGSVTAGTWSLFFRGSAVGLSTTTENIDGVAALPDGRLILSTKGNFQVAGFSGNGSDLMSFTPTQTGSATRGTWNAYLNSNDVGLSPYNVDAVAFDGTGSILMSMSGVFRLSNVNGGKSDVVRFNPMALGLTTIGSFDSTLPLTASQFGLSNFNINGLQVGKVASDTIPVPSGSGSGGGNTDGGGTATGTFQIEVNYDGSGITASQKAVFERAIQRWEQVILSEPATPEIDGVASNTLVITAAASRIDGVGGVLGNAAPTVFRPSTKLPARGEMTFDSSDLASLESTGDLYTVILHEMGHVLGIGTVWTDLRLVQRVGSQYRFTGANAVAQYNTIFGTTSTYVPVESRGGSGTRGSHWSDSTFNNELMTGYINSGKSNPLSKVTIGSLQDLGYTVNYAAADSYSAGSSVRSNVQLASANGSGSANLVTVLTIGLSSGRDHENLVSPQSLATSNGTVAVPLMDDHANCFGSASSDGSSQNSQHRLDDQTSSPHRVDPFHQAIERLVSHLNLSLNV